LWRLTLILYCIKLLKNTRDTWVCLRFFETLLQHHPSISHPQESLNSGMIKIPFQKRPQRCDTFKEQSGLKYQPERCCTARIIKSLFILFLYYSFLELWLIASTGSTIPPINLIRRAEQTGYLLPPFLHPY